MKSEHEPVPGNPTRVFGIKAQLLFVFGWFCIGLGVVGVVLPLLPTTPFLLLALWAFSRSSPRFQSWLWSHNILGPYVRDWVTFHVIPVKAKILSIVMMSLSFAWVLFYSQLSLYLLFAVGMCLACVGVYIITRPSVP